MTAHAHPPTPRFSPRAILLIELALAMGGFAIGTGEFAIMGLMPNVAQGLGISEPQVGHVISTYALGVVVGAPLLAILGARLFRRHLLLLLMSFFALGNFASAMAPDYHSLMVPADQRAKAVSRVLAGLTIAILIGNPTATWLGQWLSWRWAFGLVGMVALLTVLLVALFLPLDRSEPRNNPMRELRDFNRKPVWLALAISSIGFAGMFCVFSYLAPTLLDINGASENWIPVGLAAFGLGAIIGNLFGGWLFDRLGFKAIAWLLLWSIFVLLIFPFATHSLWTLLPAAFAVGTMVSLSPALQTHLMDVAADAQTLAAASNHSAFNVANALGPWLGGMAISAGLGWSSTGYIGAATGLIGLLVFWWAWNVRNDDDKTTSAAVACD
ncbi:MFS transporter [Pseudomonas knackmussii]|uniref:MFS transporter n=1 Tax=Pseudomonas knackmussii TaxID=65741 RepID=A0ABY4KTI6_9PSED|nr:MFS transporter [Pseudomonas knackmussii]UPQ83879.1 MFS transporter [Pseudomonas knackmussii]